MLESRQKSQELPILEEQKILLELIEEIDSRRMGVHWALGLDDLSMFLAVSREDLLRWQYRVGNGQMFSVGDLEYTEENVADLLALLLEMGYKQASAYFFLNGYYIDDDHSIDWLEFFQSVVLSRFLSDEIDQQLLEDAVKASRYFDDAVRFYGHSRFETDELIEFAVGLFIKRNNLPDHDLSWHLYRANIKSRLQLAYLRWEHLYDAMYDRLLDIAIQRGLVDAANVLKKPGAVLLLEPEVRKALQMLEFPAGMIPDAIALKQQYRKMLKKHHPDLNPEGQDLTRDLIQAYSLLHAQIV